MRYFTPFRFDERHETLWRKADQVHLTHKAASLLRCLLDRPGEWVSKETILAAVWPDTHVQPENIKVLVHEIRVALGDTAHQPQFIRSEPRRGYAFVARVTGTPAAADDDPDAAIVPVFVDRGPELAGLVDAFDAALAGQPRVVLVVGERGIGKSTLCAAFLRTAHALGSMRSSWGRCLPHAEPGETFTPWVDALRRLDRQSPGLVPPALARHAPAWLAQFPEWRHERAARRQGAISRQTMVQQLGTALEHLAADLPLVLVLEDLDWSDEASRAALVALAGRGRAAKLLVIGTAATLPPKPVALSQAERPATPGLRVMPLPPLSETHVSRYLDARFGAGCLTGLAPALHEVSGGNPFLMVASVENLITLGLVKRAGRGWQRDAPLDMIAAALSDAPGGEVWGPDAGVPARTRGRAPRE